jgi:hypothetical protein
VGSWQTGTPRDLEPWQAYYWAAFPEMAHSPSPAEDVITATNSLNGIFVELREAAKARPLSRFNIQYEKGPGATVPHYAILQALVNVLGLRATAELRLNRPTDAFEDVRLAFLTVDSIRGEPLLISGLVRISFISILNGPIWEGIVLHRWTDDQLLTLETQLRRIDCLSDYSRGIRAERAESSELLKMISADPRIAGLFDPPLSKPAGAILPWMKLLPGWADQNLVRENQWIQEILSCVDGEAQRVDVARASREKEELEERGHPTPYTFLARGIARNCNATLPKFTVAQAWVTWVNEAIIACAIERYRLAHGALPATLDELHMAALPHDVVNGEPLRYRVAGDDNYVLYSVGWNGVDDGGKAVKKSNGAIDLTRGDWVWSLRPF